MVLKSDSIELARSEKQYVSRGGIKLAHALSTFHVSPTQMACVDVGASTGGFTDCLLQAGAASVTTIDVGYGLLHEHLVKDSRVNKNERLSIRDAQNFLDKEKFQLLVADLSFISLTTVLSDLVNLCVTGAPMILLVKPQFESSREEADRCNGVIRDPRIWIRTLQEVAAQAEKEAAPIQGVAISPISGARGNREFFFYLRKGAEEKFVDIPAVISNVKGVSE
ncbi:MAG: SAM-dependent methyltransferase [Acidimicrobiales bacterium]|nr:SAM-dependent methyltransferase [Acidimicrobiales bacterium]